MLIMMMVSSRCNGKIIVALAILTMTIGFATTSPTELIQQIGEQVLVDYTKPLVNSIGAALNSGLYHTAASHKPGGFDLKLAAMYVPIPDIGKTYNYNIPGLTVNTTTNQLDTVWFQGTANTIFGPKSWTRIQHGPDTIPIPESLPRGLGLSFFPLVIPQLSVGICYGSEITIRYVPKFHLRAFDIDEEIGFLGVGIKEDITNLPIPVLHNLPFNIAVQGVYQSLQVGDIVTSTALNFNVHASKKFAVITPYIGIGWEDAKLQFKYSFSYQEPDPNNPTQPITRTVNIDKTIPSDNKIRLVAGFTLNLGPILFNAAYNLSKYSVISGGLGISVR
jgi:hypothetical protein